MFHEGAPGHHLQPGTAALNTTTLDRFQRLACEMRPGPCEGRGLYAERLTDELGYFADPRTLRARWPPVTCCAPRGSTSTSASSSPADRVG
ncbi:DUF885 family protein [Streptomyces albidoflavus]|uniref:DUF885 family protein n=1 Tax=Streptomyces albidoflavus TaxID=1886 RepID=UPI0033DA14AC